MARRPKRLRLVTWNINSLRLRLARLADLAVALEPDVICLQETKVTDEEFPLREVRATGYRHIAHRGEKGYNGVAILSKIPLRVVSETPDWCGKGESRHLAVDLDISGAPVRLHNFYVPAGGDVPDPAVNPKFRYKLDFVAEVAAWFANGVGAMPRQIIAGDLNIAPLPDDVWSHRQLLDVVSHTPVETQALGRWQATGGGWVDAMRHFIPPPEKLYTWWSYRNRDWRLSDRGRRLDHIWVTPDLIGTLKTGEVLKDARDWPLASDHVPVCVEMLV